MSVLLVFFPYLFVFFLVGCFLLVSWFVSSLFSSMSAYHCSSAYILFVQYFCHYSSSCCLEPTSKHQNCLRTWRRPHHANATCANLALLKNVRELKPIENSVLEIFLNGTIVSSLSLLHSKVSFSLLQWCCSNNCKNKLVTWLPCVGQPVLTIIATPSFSKSSVVKMFFAHTKTKTRRFQRFNLRFEERSRKAPLCDRLVWKVRRNRRNSFKFLRRTVRGA